MAAPLVLRSVYAHLSIRPGRVMGHVVGRRGRDSDWRAWERGNGLARALEVAGQAARRVPSLLVLARPRPAVAQVGER